MPEYTVTEFADKIRTKYDAYYDMDDSTLVNKIVAKYPEYESWITSSGDQEEVEEVEVEEEVIETPNETVVEEKEEVVTEQLETEESKTVDTPKPTKPTTPRIQELNDEILQLETDLIDWFPKDGVMGAPGSVVEKELDEYYANQGPTRDADNYNKRKKLDQLKLQAVPTKEELIVMNEQASEIGYTTPLPSEILDPSNKYTNQDLMSLAQQHTNHGDPMSEQSRLMGEIDPVFRMYQNLQFQNRLNGGEGEEEKIKAQQRQMSLESRGVNESFRVNAPVIADMVTHADDPTGELNYRTTQANQYGINPWMENVEQDPKFIERMNETPEIAMEFEGGVKLMNGPLPLGHGDRSALGYLWENVSSGIASSPLGGPVPFVDKHYHYQLPDGKKVPLSYFHSPEVRNYYKKQQVEKRKQDDILKFKGDRQKQTQNAVTEVESFLTDNELLYKDQEAELQKLKNESKDWKKDDPRFKELTQLENTIDTRREELQLGERLFDENGNLLNSISSVENQEINSQAEEIVKDQGKDQIEKSLEQAYYNYIELLNQVGRSTVDIGKSRSFIEKAGGLLRYDKYNLFQHSGLNPDRDTWYDDARNIQKMISSGELGKAINLPGNHPLAAEFEAAQDRMLVLNRALQLNSDQSTMAEINEVRRNVGNLLEAFSVDDPFQSFYGTGLSVGTSDEEDRYKIMKDIKEELGYTLPKEVLDAHDETWYELTGDVVTGLAPIIATVTGMNKFMPMAKGKANVINKLGDVLKGSGKSRVWNGFVNTFIGSTKYNHSALNEVAMFSMVDEIGAEVYNAHEADKLFIGSLGAGNSLWNQASTKLAGRYGKFMAPVLNKLGYFSSGKRALAVAGQTGVSTTIFEGAKGVEYIVHNGLDGVTEQFTSKQLVADYLGFLAFNVPGQMKPGIQDAGRDILRLSGHTPEALKAQKVLGVTKGKDGYYGTPKDIQNTVNEKINEIVEKPLTEKELAEEISNMDQNKDLVHDGKPITQKQRNEIQKVQEAGEALMFHNDVVKAQKTAKYMKGLDAQAFTVGQKILRGEKLTAADKALLNKLGPEYIAYKASGNKQPGEQMRAVVESIYAGDQRAYTGLAAAGINPMSEEGIELVETITDINNLEAQQKKLEKAIKEDPALEPVIQKEIDNIELEKASKKEYMDLIQSEVKDVSDKTYEQDVVETKDLIDQINEQGGFFGDKIELKEVSETDWRKLKLDPGAEGQFRDNTLYINKDVALRRQANSVASHELLHALLKNSFKNPNGTITEGGMKIIDSFREMLPPEQQKLINDRISEQYAKDQTVPKDKYYEEYLNAFVDGIKRGTIQYSDRTFNKLADQLGSRFRKQTGVGSGKELYKFLRDFNKANTDVRAKKRIIDFATKDNVPGKPAAEAPKTKTTPKKKPKAEAKKKTAEVEEKLDVEEVVEEKAPESTTVKEKRKYKSPNELIKDLKVVDKKALEEIKDAEESAIGSQNELVDVTIDSKGNQVATMIVGGKTLKNIPVKTNVESVASKSRELKKQLVSENKELFANKPEGWQAKMKENAEKIKSLDVKVNSFDDLAKVDYRKYKTKEEWQNSPEYAAALEFLYNSPKVKSNIDKKLSSSLEGGDRELAQGKAFDKLIDEFARFDPTEVAGKGKSTLLSFVNTKLKQRTGDVGKQAVKKKTTSLDKPVSNDEGRVITKGDRIADTTPEVGSTEPKGPAPKSTMRKSEPIKLTPKEKQRVEEVVDKFIKETIPTLSKKYSKKALTTKLRQEVRKEIKNILLDKIPQARKIEEYKKILEETYEEFKKLANFKLAEGGRRLEGDPFVFIKPGGKGYKDFIYSEKGFTKSGAPKRVQVRKGKETVAYDFKEFGEKPGQISKQDWVDFHFSRGEFKGGARPNELRTQMVDMMAETIFKDAMPEAIKRNKESLGKEVERDLLAEQIANDIMRNPDLILSKSKDLKGIENALKEFKDNSKDPAFRRMIDSMESLRAADPEAFAEMSYDVGVGLNTLGEWLSANPKHIKHFELPILKNLEAIAKAAKEEGGASFSKGVDALPNEVTVKGKKIDISQLKEYLKSPEASMYGTSAGKGKQKAYFFNEAVLSKYIDNAVKFAEKLPPWLREMANKEAILQTVGLGTTPTGKSALSVQEAIARADKKISEYREKNAELFFKKPKGWEKKIDENNKRIEKLKAIDPTPKILKETGGKLSEMFDNPFVKSQGTRVMDALGKNESKAFKGLKEKLKDFYSDSQMKTQMGKEFKDLTDAEIAEFVSKKINEGNNALRKEVYDAIQKAKEEYIAEAKTEAEVLDRIEYVLRKAKENTNLVQGLDRQAVPIEAIYWPKGKRLDLETLKLEHLKTSVDQSMQSAKAIVEGKWKTDGKKSMEDYVGVLSPKRLLDVIDDIGGRTNTSTIARMALDLKELKNYRTVESGFKETYYDAIVNRTAKDLNLSKAELNVLREPWLTDGLSLYLKSGKTKAGELILKKALERRNDLKKISSENKELNPIKSQSKDLDPVSVSIEKLVKADEAARRGRKLNKPVKKARVFDFDDTVARTNSKVFATKDGNKKTLTAEEFAKQGEQLVREGWKMDFSDFNRVVEGKKGPLFDLMKKMKEAAGDRDMFILTARAQDSAPAIKRFLKEMGIDIPLSHIKGLGNSTGAAKAEWILDKAAEGYNDFYFADDAVQNVKAVKDVLSQIDVKSQVQQAIASKSKDLDGEFNRILEASTGIEWFKEFSPVKGEVLGKRKGKGKFFLPPGAEDFLGLVYPTLNKGKLGENQLKWYENNLFKPYNRGVRSMASARTTLMADFKQLKKDLEVPKDLRETTESGFTNEHAVRAFIWKSQGNEIPGLSKKDLKELTDIIENNPKLKAFAEQLQTITKGDKYFEPKKEWLSGTITTDLINLLNTSKRNKFLEEWNENVKVIFSEKNLNKLEAAYGKKYREALENSIKRMKTGVNRTSTGNKFSDGLLDYINGAQGTIMFLNMRSALLQSISAANYINMGFNNPIKAGKALANMPQYSKDFVKIMNSDYLVDRRNGLKLNISESEIADAAGTSKNKAKAIINYILEKGYTPTKFMDSFAIASGGATWYRNRYNELTKKEGMSPKEAEAKAWEEFIDISEKSQQSSDPSKISKQQASDTGRIFLQFVNTPMQYTRLQKRAFQDLVNKRGNWKKNIGKIMYYGVVQNLWFNAMQQGLFALGFGDDELDDKEEKKIYNTANGMADSILRGAGLGGMTVSVLKNTIIDIYRRSQKSRPEFSDAWIKLLEFSPAIKSKMSKLRSAGWPFDSKKRRQEVMDKGFSLDNPAWESGAKVVSATTNIPLDRLYNKYNNISAMAHEDAELWQQIALFLGWPAWDIAPELEDE
tara:strand:+ start:26024 stop:36031 length:10008 start_codon:yes stop_codon:yes gene_type:complete